MTRHTRSFHRRSKETSSQLARNGCQTAAASFKARPTGARVTGSKHRMSAISKSRPLLKQVTKGRLHQPGRVRRSKDGMSLKLALSRGNYANVTEALKKLANLRTYSFKDGICRREICRSSGPAVIVECMKKHQDDAKIQCLAIRALFCGCLGLGTVVFTSSLENNRKLETVLEDGVVATIKAMSKFQDHSVLQTWGCYALLRLSTGRGNLIFTSGGIPVLVNAMKQYVENRALQRYAADTLDNLALSGGNPVRKAIADSGGVDAVTKGARAHDFRLFTSALFRHIS